MVLSTITQSSPYSDLYKDVKSSVVVVQANNSQNEPISQGSGFFIDKAGDIITNYHIINGSNKVTVTTADGHSYPVKNVLVKDISSDLACLSVDIPSQLVYPIKVNTTSPEVGDEILVIGYPEGPGGLAQSMTRGIVSSVQTLNEYGEVIQIDAAVSPGASGSPLVNMKCEAIGVTTFGYIEGQNQNFAVSYMQVSKLINRISSKSGTPISEWNLTSGEKSYSNGVDLYRKGKYNESMYYLKEAIKLNPQENDNRNVDMGVVLAKQGMYEQALDAFNRQINLVPGESDRWNIVWAWKAAALYKLGRYEEAREAIVHELQLNQFKENTVDSLINQIGLLGKSNQILSDADVQDFTNQMENNSNSPDTQAPAQTSDSCCVAFLQNHVQLPGCSYEVLNKCAHDAGLI